jgi:hypothetical protein
VFHQALSQLATDNLLLINDQLFTESRHLIDERLYIRDFHFL